MQTTTRLITDGEYNKRIACVAFIIRKHAFDSWAVFSTTISGATQDTCVPFVEFHSSRNKLKAEAVRDFLNDMPLLRLDDFLRSKDVTFAKWLDGRE